MMVVGTMSDMESERAVQTDEARLTAGMFSSFFSSLSPPLFFSSPSPFFVFLSFFFFFVY